MDTLFNGMATGLVLAIVIIAIGVIRRKDPGEATLFVAALLFSGIFGVFGCWMAAV